MQLISSNKVLEKELQRLIKTYPNISFAVAWASFDTQVFSDLVANKGKIQNAVIGTHFYQTHPDVLATFVDSETVRFMLQPSGVFHPKVFVFWNENAWEILLGSANLTAGAFKSNTELTLLTNDADGTPSLKDEVLAQIAVYSAAARVVNEQEAQRYRDIWALKQPVLDRLVDNFGSRVAKKLSIDSSVMSMDWSSYLAQIKQDPVHGFNERLSLLRKVRGVFEQHAHFNDMDIQVRRGIAGVQSTFLPNSEWFGSMTGAGVFRSLILNGAPAFSLALDQIPLTGPVGKAEYDAFIEEYLKAYASGRDGIGTATRLLCMKRPDIFLCVDSANRTKLAEDIGIARPDQIDYQRYWSEIVLRIQAAPWWNAPEPAQAADREAWWARTAMLDALFYEQK